MECRRITFYQQLNRYNRKINSAILSLDSLTEDYKDSVAPTSLDSYLFEVHELIAKHFEKEEHMIALILNAILYENWEVSKENSKRLVNYLKKLSITESEIISSRYNVDRKIVEKSITFCNKLTMDELRRKIQYSFIILKDIIKEIR